MLSNTLKDACPLLLQGACTTAALWFGGMLISLTVGGLWGVLRARRVRLPLIGGLLDAVTFVLRAVPFYVQLLIAYFVVPQVLGISPSAQVASVTALGLCSAAYVSQIVRGGIDVVPEGQWLACHVLGYSTMQALWYVVIPQALCGILPALVGECDQLLKSTAVVSSLGTLELTRAAMNVVARELNPLEMYLAIAVVYAFFSSVLMCAAWLLERRVAS